MTEAVPPTSPQFARTLAARLRDAVEAADRLASFAFNGESGPVASRLADGEEEATAHDFVLRMFQGASDPLNNRILSAAVGSRVGVGTEELAQELSLTPIAVLERVNELIQLGLVARDLQLDVIRATAAGEEVVTLIGALESEVAEWLRHRKRT